MHDIIDIDIDAIYWGLDGFSIYMIHELFYLQGLQVYVYLFRTCFLFMSTDAMVILAGPRLSAPQQR